MAFTGCRKKERTELRPLYLYLLNRRFISFLNEGQNADRYQVVEAGGGRQEAGGQAVIIFSSVLSQCLTRVINDRFH